MRIDSYHGDMNSRQLSSICEIASRLPSDRMSPCHQIQNEKMMLITNFDNTDQLTSKKHCSIVDYFHFLATQLRKDRPDN